MPFFQFSIFIKFSVRAGHGVQRLAGREGNCVCVCVCMLIEHLIWGRGMAEIISPLVRAEAFRVFSFPFEAILSVICELIQFDKLA